MTMHNTQYNLDLLLYRISEKPGRTTETLSALTGLELKYALKLLKTNLQYSGKVRSTPFKVKGKSATLRWFALSPITEPPVPPA